MDVTLQVEALSVDQLCVPMWLVVGVSCLLSASFLILREHSWLHQARASFTTQIFSEIKCITLVVVAVVFCPLIVS
jgi:hypothetical protein